MNTLFKKNLEFFYHNLPSYYHLIRNIKTRRFLIKNNNIFDTLTNSYIFPNSIDDGLQFAKTPTHNPLWEKEFFQTKLQEWEEKFFLTGKTINNIIKKVKDKKEFFFDKDFLPSTIILGILGGNYIQELVKKYEFQSLFIYEPNPEFFAISLYYIDYPFIYNKLQNRLFIWINGKIDYKAIEKFYYERVITSSFLNLTLKTYNHPLIEDAKQKFNEIKLAKLRGWGSVEDELKGIKNHQQNKNKYPLLIKPKKINKPFCIVANGKSLEKNIEFIKKNKDSFFIVSVGTAIKPLLKANIESDFHIEQERTDTLIDALEDVLKDYNGYFIGASVVNNKIFQMAKNPLMYIREGFSLENEYKLIGSSPIVGNSGIAFASLFTNEIYLCGMDLGFRLNQKKHAKGSFYDDKEDKETQGIKIEGNFSDDIYTNSLFLSSKQKIEELIKLKNLKVYNLSDGAFIKGSIPLKDKTLPKIKKESLLFAFKKIEYKNPRLNIKKYEEILLKSLDLKITNLKELTGIIDFIEDTIKETSKKDPNTYLFLRGSIFHILNMLYISAHKVENNKLDQFLKETKKEIKKFFLILNSLLN